MTLPESIQLYPDPKITTWYLGKFPKREFNIVMISLFATGFVATIIGTRKENYKETNWYKVTGIATLLFLVGLLIGTVIHTWAWIAKRRVEKKRAKAMGITLQEYWNLCV